MIVTVGKNGTIPLPDELNELAHLELGDILLCTLTENKQSIRLEKYKDQTLTDNQIAAHGFLTRIEEINHQNFE